MFVDKKFRKARIWSNTELAKFAFQFKGKVANVSGWKDEDKEGRNYKDYFTNASEYWITNYISEARGYQGDLTNELFLDLEQKITASLVENFDVVFNHTVLEHVFEIDVAFNNLCMLSKDIVIIVVPFLQEQHGAYGDFWRFTPLTISRLFKKNNMELVYLNFNDEKDASIYIFAIGSKKANTWKSIFEIEDNQVTQIDKIYLGKNIIKNSFLSKVCKRLIG